MSTVEDERKDALATAIADATAHGWRIDPDSDYRAVLAGNNAFRAVLHRRRWGLDQHALIDVDKDAEVTIKWF